MLQLLNFRLLILKNIYMLRYLLYTFSLMLFWGLLFLDNNNSGLIGVLLGMIYTFYSSFFIKSTVQEETFILKIIKISGPIIYVVSNIVINKINSFSLINPINIAFFIFFLPFFIKSNFPSRNIQFFVISFIYLYSFTIYEKWERKLESTAPIYDFNLHDNSQTKSTENLYDFKFLNSKIDTISIPSSNKFTIIETWNEKCIPCLYAIPGMIDFYNSIEKQTVHFYVYKPKKNHLNLDYNKVFNFNKINNPQEILIDINMYDLLNINGYPYFLLFDKNGRLVFSQLGYSDKRKVELQDSIKKYIN